MEGGAASRRTPKRTGPFCEGLHLSCGSAVPNRVLQANNCTGLNNARYSPLAISSSRPSSPSYRIRRNRPNTKWMYRIVALLLKEVLQLLSDKSCNDHEPSCMTGKYDGTCVERMCHVCLQRGIGHVFLDVTTSASLHGTNNQQQVGGILALGMAKSQDLPDHLRLKGTQVRSKCRHLHKGSHQHKGFHTSI